MDQAGWVSPDFASFSWHVLAAAPTVVVRTRPDAVSGAWRPVFVVAADWGPRGPPVGGQDVAVLEFQLIGDKERGVYVREPAAKCGVGVGGGREGAFLGVAMAVGRGKGGVAVLAALTCVELGRAVVACVWRWCVWLG